ncbi:hypothetical protein ACEPAF_7750 [Sanghuangporus sanghuang]
MHPSCARPRLVFESKVLQRHPQRASKSHYSDSSTAESQARRFGRLIVKGFLGGVALYCCWSAVIFAFDFMFTLYPPQLMDWPKEIRRRLVLARSGIILCRADLTLEQLEEIWTTVRDAPEHMLHPNSSIKFLNVAIWFSDELERAGKAREAYKVLCDAICIYRSRYQRHSGEQNGRSLHAEVLTSGYTGTDNKSTAALDSDELVERRFLISMLSKLTSLSENCEPTAEGKWLSSAIREMIPLFPVCQGLREEEVYEIIGHVEQFATVEPSFFGISSYLQSHSNLPTGLTNSQQTEGDSTADLEISEDKVTPEDEYLSLPFWCASDVPSAIAIPLKYIGIFAAKHGHSMCVYCRVFMSITLIKSSSIAYNAYTSALLVSWLRGTAKSDSRLEDWEYGFRALEYLNSRIDFMFRHLDIAIYPHDWCSMEHRWIPPTLLPTLKLINDVEKEGTLMIRKHVEKFRTCGAILALATKHKAIFLEKVGDLDEALNEFESSIELWELSKRPTSNQEIRDIQERIERVKRRIAEGDTSVDDQIHPDILMSWKEMKKRALGAKSFEDGGATT